MNDVDYTLLKRRIKELLSIDIDAYKTGQMRRRLETFVSRRATASVAEFCRDLPKDQDALDALRDMLTINVSEFFRDPQQFERLQSQVMPEILQGGQKIRIWSSACSHGEEPYSIAMILHELNSGSRATIMASDIDRTVLARAKAGGPYVGQDVRNVGKQRLESFFTRDGDNYTVVDMLRRRIDFREVNLLSDRFEPNFDLIVCRNVMIYFSDETKRGLFERFRASLRPGGVLFVGGTEALLGSDSLGYERMGGNFYRRTTEAAQLRRTA